MTTSLWIVLATIVVLLCISAFFSGSETALTAVSKARMISYEKNGDERAVIVSRLIEKKDRLIGALLLGNNLVNIFASSLATTALLGLFGEAGVAYATVAMTILVVVFGEVLPKSLAIARPDTTSLRLAASIDVVVKLLGPLTALVNLAVRSILALFGISLERGASMLTAHEELRGAVEVLHREGALVAADRVRLGGLLDLAELEVADVMVHRTNMRQLNADDPPQEIVRQILESPYTRMPLWRRAPDNIIGVVHAKDLLRALQDAGNDPSKIDIVSIASKPWFVPETTPLQDQLNAFLRRKAHFALVVDEYGEVEGLITLEDILEEIVGEIADEHDVDMEGVKVEADGSVIVDGQVPIRDLNRALDWALPDDEAVTIAGLVIHETQTIPQERQAFTFFQKRFTVLKRDKNRIAKLRIRPASLVVPPKRKGAVAVGDEAVGVAVPDADVEDYDDFEDIDGNATDIAPEIEESASHPVGDIEFLSDETAIVRDEDETVGPSGRGDRELSPDDRASASREGTAVIKST